MKTILVLPGSYWQIPLVQKIREMGHKALIVDPHEDAPCFPYADGYLQSDIFDWDNVIDYAKANKIDAVMSDQCDIAMPVVARISEELKLSALSVETARLFTNKFLMREFCCKNGLKYPEYSLCRTAGEAVALLCKLKRPLIIKPLDSNASHGVFKVKTEKDIESHFAEALSFSRGEKAVVAERFIEGTEFTVDGVKTPSAHYTLAISEKDHFRHNINIANELLFSHINEKYDYDALRRVNDSFVMQSGLPFGFTHAEYKYEDGEFYLIEIAARGGGNMISSLITQHMSGYDTYRYLVECAAGNVHDENFSIRGEYRDRVAVLKFFETPNGGGTVKEVRGLDILESEPDIKEYRLYFKVGDTIGDCVSDSARIGFYIACSENVVKLRNIISKIENGIQIILE